MTITKNKLLEELKTLKELEESLLPMLSKYLPSIIFLDKDQDVGKKQARVQELISSQAKHSEKLQDIIEEVEEGNKNVY